jgi:small subunit ribosomal protein S16
MISRDSCRSTLYSNGVVSHQSFSAECAPHAHGKQFALKNHLWRIVAVKIRLKRMGKIRAPYYRIVVADSHTKRDGRVIEEIGKYHPTEEPSFIEVDSARAQYWLGVGAQPTEQVAAILKLTGDWGIFKGDKNAVSTVRTKESKVDFVADEKKKPVLKPKAEAPAPKGPVAEAPVAEAPVAEDPVAEAPAAEASTDAAAEAPEAEIAPAVEGLNDADAAQVEAVSDVAEAKADDATEADAEAASAEKA